MSPEAAELADLLALIASKDRRAFARLYEATSAKLFGTVLRVLRNREDAEDALQDTYVAVWASASRYRREVYSPISWLAVIARNRAIDRLRKLRLSPADSIDDFPSLVDGGRTPEANAISKEITNQMNSAIAQLKVRPGSLVRDAYLEGYSYIELSAMYGMPLNTVRTTLRRSLSAMRLTIRARTAEFAEKVAPVAIVIVAKALSEAA